MRTHHGLHLHSDSPIGGERCVPPAGHLSTEYVGGTPGCLDRIFADLAERNVHLTVDRRADVA